MLERNVSPTELQPEAVFETFRGRSDEAWLDILLASVRAPEIDGVRMPAFPAEHLQREMHGHAGAVSLHEAFSFFREIKAYAEYAGRPLAPHRTLLDFGCGWGRVLRLFMKDVQCRNLFGAEPTPRFLAEARMCNPAVTFLPAERHPPVMLPDGSLDYVVAWSVFSHLDEFLANQWVEEFARVLRPGGLVFLTTQSRRFLAFCAEQRARRASGLKLDHAWHEACADSFIDEAAETARYDQGSFLYHCSNAEPPSPGAHYGEALIPRGYAASRWSRHYHLIAFLDAPVRLPQALIVLQRRPSRT